MIKRLGKDKCYLLIAVVLLIIIGFGYAIASAEAFKNSALACGMLMELVPEECQVLDTSPDVSAAVEFPCDRFGNIADKMAISLMASNVYPGAYAEFRITAHNTSDIALSVDEYKLEIDKEDNSLENLIYFSGAVEIIKYGGQYSDVLGSFENVSLGKLDDQLTAILKYRKIDVDEKLVLVLNQQFEDDHEKFAGKTGLSYKLRPVFIQYFPKKDKTLPESE